MNFHIFFRKTALALFVGIGLLQTPVVAEAEAQKPEAKPETIYQKLAQLHLPALVKQSTEEEKKESELIKENEKNAQGITTLHKIQIPEVSEVEKLKIIYRIFDEHTANQPLAAYTPILNENVISDLEMFCSGDKENLDRYVFKHIDYTTTMFGRVQLQKMLAQPTTNIDLLTHRQNIIKELINNPGLINDLIKHLEKIKEATAGALWFWKLFGGRNLEKANSFPNFWLFKHLNKSPFCMELSRISLPLSVLGWCAYGTTVMALGIANNNPSVAACGTLLDFYGFVGIGGVFLHNEFNKKLHAKMNDFATFTNESVSLGHLINMTGSLKNFLPEHELMQTVVNPSAQEAAHLVQMLREETFDQTPSFFSYQGRALAAYNKLVDEKNHFLQAMMAVGELDAYLSIAQLYLKHQHNSTARYCFAQYRTADKPMIAIDQVWHPSLDPKKVVASNVSLGGDNNPTSLIVTGVNAGGKSTVLKATTFAVWLAQTIGIVPASSIILTPLSKINTYMNVADSTGYKSLFQAEMHRAGKLLQSLKEMPKNQFALIIMDEIFTGTNPSEGSAGAFGVAEKLISFDNALNIFATHYMVLTELEQESKGRAENNKVSVIEHADGSLTFPYKLEKGIANQAIALKLMKQEEGFDNDIMQSAYRIMHKNEKRAAAVAAVAA